MSFWGALFLSAFLCGYFLSFVSLIIISILVLSFSVWEWKLYRDEQNRGGSGFWIDLSTPIHRGLQRSILVWLPVLWISAVLVRNGLSLSGLGNVLNAIFGWALR